MDDDDEKVYHLENPLAVLKMSLQWVPNTYLYHGIVEMLDSIGRGVDDSDDNDEDYHIMESLDVLFRASMTGECFHPKEDHQPPPLDEDDLERFRKMLDIPDDGDYTEDSSTKREEN